MTILHVLPWWQSYCDIARREWADMLPACFPSPTAAAFLRSCAGLIVSTLHVGKHTELQWHSSFRKRFDLLCQTGWVELVDPDHTGAAILLLFWFSNK